MEKEKKRVEVEAGGIDRIWARCLHLRQELEEVREALSGVEQVLKLIVDDVDAMRFGMSEERVETRRETGKGRDASFSGRDASSSEGRGGEPGRVESLGLEEDSDGDRSQRRMSEDHGEGEGDERGWVDRFVDALKDPGVTESRADSDLLSETSDLWPYTFPDQSSRH